MSGVGCVPEQSQCVETSFLSEHHRKINKGFYLYQVGGNGELKGKRFTYYNELEVREQYHSFCSQELVSGLFQTWAKQKVQFS